VSNTHYGEVMRFPFQPLGFIALIILFLMAASSHDFWLKNLSPQFWKAMHMLVYVAYALIVMHVLLGVVQLESNPLLMGSLGIGMLTLILLHIISGYKTRKNDQAAESLIEDGYHKICAVSEIEDNCAKMARIGKKSIAVFKYEDKLSAVDNACKHQNGPLSEGRIIDGCITCPWHGYQYQPHNQNHPIK
jgi:hypothetical protein